jgi:aldehyde dehydrogenase (NAD+)
MHPDIRRVLELQQKSAKELARTSVDERIERLMRIDNYLKDEDRLADLFDAMYKDFRKPDVEVIGTEVGVVHAQISNVRRKLKRWVRQKKVPTPIPLLGTRSHIQYEPKGVVLIIAPWNYPLNLTLVPLVYAIAAGNAVVLKPSEISPHTSAYIKEMITELFDESEVSVFEGDAGVAQELLDHPFNHIFFTGSPKVGKTVMQKAAQNLTSVTLELGGKSPAIIDETADIRKSARGVAWSKSVNNGQTCITPDYLLLHESIQEEFIEEFEMALKE